MRFAVLVIAVQLGGSILLIAGVWPLLAAARFRHGGDHSDAHVQPIPQANAYSVIFQMQDFASHRLWMDRKLVHAGGHSIATMAMTCSSSTWRRTSKQRLARDRSASSSCTPIRVMIGACGMMALW